jgi:hypothetical protein
MKLTALKALIGNGTMVSIDYVTANGRKRTINGRTGVKRYLKPGAKKRKNTDNEKGIIRVWETLRPQDKERDGGKRYKSLKAERVKEVRCNGVRVIAT